MNTNSDFEMQNDSNKIKKKEITTQTIKKKEITTQTLINTEADFNGKPNENWNEMKLVIHTTPQMSLTKEQEIEILENEIDIINRQMNLGYILLEDQERIQRKKIRIKKLQTFITSDLTPIRIYDIKPIQKIINEFKSSMEEIISEEFLGKEWRPTKLTNLFCISTRQWRNRPTWSTMEVQSTTLQMQTLMQQLRKWHRTINTIGYDNMPPIDRVYYQAIENTMQQNTICKHVSICYEAMWDIEGYENFGSMTTTGNFICVKCKIDIEKLINWPRRRNMYFTYEKLDQNLWFYQGEDNYERERKYWKNTTLKCIDRENHYHYWKNCKW